MRDYGTGSWTGGDDACDHAKPLAGGTNAQGLGKSAHASAANVERSSVPYRDACGRCGARRVDQQIGLEETPDEWCNRLVSVMREARRVLRSDGVCWIEVGDTYGTNGSDWSAWKGGQTHKDRDPANARPHPFKPKDLVGAPWLLAFALRADGWYLRSDTIWARPNPMPESVTDRPTKAHSYLFLLSKSARYFYDADAIREPHTGWEQRDDGTWRNLNGGDNTTGRNGLRGAQGREVKNVDPNPAGRNARSVWSIATEPTPFAHFATFPQALVERCIKAGTSEHGACSECGAPWRRITERGKYEPAVVAAGERNVDASRGDKTRKLDGKSAEWIAASARSTVGWESSCDHGPIFDPVPCVVLDPFMGSGTTALVARRLGRHALGVELNPEYLAIAAKRLEQLSLLAGGSS